MPELPEVETVKRGLNELVKGSTIEHADVRYPKMIQNVSANDFKDRLKNKKIKRVDRRGKYLLFRLTGDMTLVSHLRMEGKYMVHKSGEPLDKHDYVIFHLNGDRELRYNDTRKFGRMWLIKNGQEKTVSGLGALGPEPTAKDLTFAYMKKIMNKSRGQIKPFLLNQSHIAGLGNIYTDEVLWMSKIHPKQKTNLISDAKIKLLRKNIINEIQAAIKGHGTTVFTYKNAFGKSGSFQHHLHVYHRTGKPCGRCGTPIKKIKVAQRGTHFCPKCQKLVK
ncbi:bifunctional DNA-formamidopyrimidine glycosylase/DNA-(apurinic or apyrimidinic site) lyase [Acetilactobacillus jinshanensis]|uniref:bifunctional DNA-formamidopyrimidine glycosylase/DNA-(apurinic or apyrimidinic site) lyase n=1 Tax=Acetilactobacillus jinshanensis TaxID=1720083 RepID=UPI003CE53ACB